MSLKRSVIINTLFILVSLIFLILSFTIDFFFFFPIFCLCPFTYRTRNRCTGDSSFQYDNNDQSNDRIDKFSEKRTNERYYFKEENNKESDVRYCQECGGEIREFIAKYCYHCGDKLV